MLMDGHSYRLTDNTAVFGKLTKKVSTAIMMSVVDICVHLVHYDMVSVSIYILYS